MRGWTEFLESGASSNGVGAPAGVLADLIERFPIVGQFLGRYVDSGGRPVKCGSMTVFFEGGRLKVCLTDHFRRLKGFATVSVHDDILEAVEAILQDDGVEWKTEKVRG